MAIKEYFINENKSDVSYNNFISVVEDFILHFETNLKEQVNNYLSIEGEFKSIYIDFLQLENKEELDYLFNTQRENTIRDLYNELYPFAKNKSAFTLSNSISGELHIINYSNIQPFLVGVNVIPNKLTNSDNELPKSFKDKVLTGIYILIK